LNSYFDLWREVILPISGDALPSMRGNIFLASLPAFREILKSTTAHRFREAFLVHFRQEPLS